MRKPLAHFRKLFVCELEDRTTPTWAVSLNGSNAVSFIGNGDSDYLTLFVEQSGAFRLSHNVPTGGNLVSQYDLNGSADGEQSLAITAVTGLTVTGNGGYDYLSVTDVATSGTVSVEDFSWQASNVLSPNADVTLTNVAFTVNDVAPYPSHTYSLSGVTSVPSLFGANGDNVIDASGWSGNGIYMLGNIGNDTLRGGTGADDIRGGHGNDTLEGNGGSDLLDYYDAGDGNDTLSGGSGVDFLNGGPGNDKFDGGTDTDYGYDLITGNATLSSTTGYTVGGSVNSPAAAANSVESWDLRGDDLPNVIDASGWAGAGMLITGNGGNDTLRGGAGNDDLRGQLGDDTLEGNDGGDLLDYYAIQDGNDILSGGPGADYLSGGVGHDKFDGGPDFDYAYDNITGNATLSSVTGYTVGGTFVSSAAAVNSIENWDIRGDALPNVIDASAWTGGPILMIGLDGNDTLRGGAGGDDLRGDLGDDTLEGNGGGDLLDYYADQSGNDILTGGTGVDYLSGGVGHDKFDGGADTDYAYDNITGNATLSSATGYSVGGGAFVSAPAAANSIENWDIRGDSLDNVIDASAWTGGPILMIGNAGNDTLRGGSGNDDLRGDLGDDILEGNAGDDLVDYYANQDGDDTLSGGPGLDYLSGGVGHDKFDGGSEVDYVDDTITGNATLSATTGYTVGGTVITPAAAALTIEFWTIRGDDLANVIDAAAWAGPVTLFGNGDNDTLRGGSGNDYLYGGPGTDLLEGHSGDDYMFGEAGNDSLDGEDGDDYLHGGGDNDLLRDGPGTNYFDGELGTDTVQVYGTSSNDLIVIDGNTVSMNGSVTTHINCEAMANDTGGGVDEGTELAGIFPYTVAGLEPTVFAGPDVTNTDVPFVFSRNCLFKDIGAGQTWTVTANYGEGGGFETIPHNPVTKTFQLNHAYSTGGVFPVVVRVTDNQGNLGQASFTIIRPAGIVIGVAGGAQRSMVEQVKVVFTSLQNLQSGWYTFERLSPGPVPTVSAAISTVGSHTEATLTFSGTGLDGTSLADGDYKLTLDSSKILSVPGGQQFDGDADGNPGGDFVFNFHRFFGDFNGDRTVESVDFAFFGNTFGTSSSQGGFTPAFDYNADGTINGATDFAQFGNRFGRTLGL